jgi:ribosomal protein S18 acetylase RimI-like enzyme
LAATLLKIFYITLNCSSIYLAMANPFCSEHLFYRAMEDTPEHSNFVHSIESDPIAFANFNYTVMKPQRKKDSVEGYQRVIQEFSLIGVLVYLPAPAPEQNTSTPAPEADDEAKDTKNDQTPPKDIPIGVVCLSKLKDGLEHHRESYCSINIAASYRSKGYGSEAIRWVLNWGFQIANLHRITIEAFSYNDGAVRLYERLGFTLEGRKRKAVWFDGAWHDDITFGILEDDWREGGRAKGREI